MKYFSYEVMSENEHSRTVKIKSAIEQGTAVINKDTLEITFYDFSESFKDLLPKAFVERFLRGSVTNFPEKKSFAFGS